MSDLKTPKPVNLLVIDPVKIDGKHYAIGDVLMQIEPELAKELTGAGRTRLATEDEVSTAAKKAAAEGKPA